MTDWERELIWGLCRCIDKYGEILPCQIKESKFEIINEKEIDEVLNDKC